MRVRERIEISTEKPTASYRELSATILSDYPYAGLLSIQDLAKRSEASTASTSRFVPKIELAGCQQFQRNLIDEQNEDKRPPVELHLGERSIEGGYLNDFVARATGQMADSASAVTEVQFRCVRELLSEPRSDVYAAGGRVSDTIAKYAAEILPTPTESGTLRDTCTPELAVAETIVTRIAEENRDQARARINAWDAIRFTEQEPKS